MLTQRYPPFVDHQPMAGRPISVLALAGLSSAISSCLDDGTINWRRSNIRRRT